MFVIATIAMVQKRTFLSPLLSALLELAKLVSILFVVDSKNKTLSIAIVMCACYVGNWLSLTVMKKMEEKKKNEDPFRVC
jgi:hypothetical protein